MPHILTEQQCIGMQDSLARVVSYLKSIAPVVPLRMQHRLMIIQREIEQTQQTLLEVSLSDSQSLLVASLLFPLGELRPSGIPLYRTLESMLARRGYGILVQGITLPDEEGRPASVEMCYALRPPRQPDGQESCLDLSLTLKALSVMSADRFFQEMAVRIDDACARGQCHRHCQCGEPLLVEEKRGRTSYRRVQDGPRGPRFMQCPRCQVVLTEQVVQEIDDISEEGAVCLQLL